VGKGLDFYSLDREIALGHQLSQEIESRIRLVKDPVITEYVNRLGQRLVRNSDAKVPFTIKVIDDDEINAFALPGGFFYVNTGLILAADNEAGLAGVMAHEIAHVAARHATKNETKSNIINLASIPLIFFGGPAAMFLRQAVDLAVPMSFLKFSRDAEREADMLGIQYDYVSGYDPEEFVKLFEKLQTTEKKKKSLMAKAFATHPMTGDRIKRAQKEIQEYLPDRDDYVVDTSEFHEVQARVAELTDRRKIDLGKVTPVLHKRESDHPNDGPTLRRQQ
jgi:beta-barrel assembly-enhancing protease